MTKPRYYECGICDHVHPWDFDGDCRDDANRFTAEALDAKHGPHGYELLPMDERVAADTSTLEKKPIFDREAMREFAKRIGINND